MSYDIKKIRSDFPELAELIRGKPLVYLDSAASALKPKVVIEAINRHYSFEAANIHRGVHYLSEQGTTQYEKSREACARFINAELPHEVIFTKGTTDALNLVANSYGSLLSAGDEIILTTMEHHSNIVPWQMIAEKTGAIIKVAPINSQGEIILDEYKKLLNKKTKVVSFTLISNGLGTINPAKEMIKMAHEVGAVTVLDAAQAAPHIKIDVKDLDCDFLALSGHKIFGPTGIGIIYGKEDLLNKIPPYQGGGDMIDRVSFEKTTYNELPFKFEAGTPHIAGAIALKDAIEYIEAIGFKDIEKHEKEILDYATDKLKQIEGLTIYGTAKNKTSVISFTLEGIHHQDAGTILDQQGIAVRTGHHCNQPLWAFYGIDGTIRASFCFYNTMEEVDLLVEGIKKVKEFF
ncbi:MAG: cysteine desulfurase CsdA [Epsilonproteobacteria bacterium]|nr:MAG: cysteine desulfurase CsdA [Campylobacterota bacterium]RLA67338.1 MAG: cysteine desulfurase CsdA [Campylobacterota bacterium]